MGFFKQKTQDYRYIALGILRYRDYNTREESHRLSILDLKTMQTNYMELDSIVKIIRSNDTIRNIGILLGRMRFTQGSEKRYPIAEVNRVNRGTSYNMETIEREFRLTVLGYFICRSNKEKIFVASNWNGELQLFNEAKLINYEERYGLTNCKVSSRNGKNCIVSLSGDLDNLEDMTSIVYRHLGVTAYVRLPLADIGTLDIPENICNEDGTVSHISIQPKAIGNTIRKLRIYRDISHLSSLVDYEMPNLKTIEFRGKVSDIRGSTFERTPNIENIFVNEAKFTWGIDLEITNLHKLKRVELGFSPKTLKGISVTNCEKFEYNSLIKEGLEEINDELFPGCCGTEHLELPKTLVKMEAIAMNKSVGLKSIRINSLLDIVDTKYYSTSVSYLEVLCPSDYPVELLMRHTSQFINVKRDTPTSKEIIGYKSIEGKVAKAKLVGKEVRLDDIAHNIQEVITNLMIWSEEDIKEMMMKLIKQDSGRIKIIGKHRLFIRVEYESVNGYTLAEATNHIKERFIDDKLYVRTIFDESTGKEHYYIIPIDKESILKWIKGYIKGNYDMKLSVAHEKEFTWRIPVIHHLASCRVLSILNRSDEICVVLENGKSIIHKLIDE